MTKQRILVCGATGFVGRNMAEAFAGDSSCELHAVFNKRLPFEDERIFWHKCDLTDVHQVEALLQTVKPAKIIQAAATTSGAKDIVSTPQIHVTDNAVMNSYLFPAAVYNEVKHLVFFSCTVMYQSSDRPIAENDYDANRSVHPRYFGAANTKLYLEKMCEFYSSLGDTKFTAIRHSNIYGPHDKFDLERSHFFGATITKVLEAKDCITVWGTGEEERDLLYVDDLVAFVAKVFAGQTKKYRMYHCGSGRAESIRSVVEKIIKASGKSLSVNNDLMMPTINTSFCLDCTRAEKELGWRPQISLDDGIALTIEWWKENFRTAKKE